MLPAPGSVPATGAPAAPVRLIFAHHSTGEAWLADGYGDLGVALRDNNYAVSDTNYGWGPDNIGDRTDVGHWWSWFRGPQSATYTSALFSEDGQHSSYSRMGTMPSGENTIIMFKSCFPNADVGGSPGDAVPAIGGNPLKGESGPLTVGNAKGVYLDLLEYFKTRPDKLFVLVVSPPLRESDTSPENAANARALADWLVSPDGLLSGYTTGNVFVFDYYTVLTGGHHRVVGGSVEHVAGPSDYLAYPTGDSHPSAEGDAIATAEFVPMLNAAYGEWSGASRLEPRAVTLSRPKPSSSRTIKHGVKRSWQGTISPAQLVDGAVVIQVQRRLHGAWHSYKTVSTTAHAGSASWKKSFTIGKAGRFRLRVKHADGDHLAGRSTWREITVK